jgi:hypothetical protein
VWRVRDLLGRLRPLAAPGPPARAGVGVPGDRRAERSAELAPVFAALAGAEAEAAAIRRQAADEARRRRDRTAAELTTMTADADARVAAERRAAREQARRKTRDETARLLAAAEGEAARQRELAARRMPELVALVVADVRRLADAGQPEGDREQDAAPAAGPPEAGAAEAGAAAGTVPADRIAGDSR